VTVVRFGIAVAALVTGVLMLWGLIARGMGQLLDANIPAVPLTPMIIVVGVALVAGSIAGALLDSRTSPREPERTEHAAPAGPTPPAQPSGHADPAGPTSPAEPSPQTKPAPPTEHADPAAPSSPTEPSPPTRPGGTPAS